MQEWKSTSVRTEITRLKPQVKIGNECGACSQLLPQAHHIGGQQEPPAGDEADEENQEQGREKTAYPPRVEAAQAEYAQPGLIQYDSGNQKSGYDEEHVDADEPSRHIFREPVERHDRYHGQRAQTVDVRSIAGEIANRTLVCQFHPQITAETPDLELSRH